MTNELMIDIESSGNVPGCKVLSLGAFGFDRKGNQVEFYKKFSPTKQIEAGLFDTADTMNWWNNQDEETRLEAFSGTADPVEAIAEFKQFFYKNFSLAKKDEFRVWACGIDFDFPILQAFFKAYGFHLPWKYLDQHDYRTIRNVFKFVKAQEMNGAKHNAIEDAKAQMRGLRAFYEHEFHKLDRASE